MQIHSPNYISIPEPARTRAQLAEEPRQHDAEEDAYTGRNHTLRGDVGTAQQPNERAGLCWPRSTNRIFAAGVAIPLDESDGLPRTTKWNGPLRTSPS